MTGPWRRALALAVLAAAPIAVGAQCIAASASCGLLVDAARHDSAAAAFARGLTALASTHVDRFAMAHPQADGRGVLIAILDSGIDPGIPGLGLTSDGAAKLLDLRDFSGEGRVALQRIVRRGDTLLIGSHRLLGAGAVSTASDNTELWGGTWIERQHGRMAADLNGNGSNDDTLLLVVAHARSGWMMFADTKGRGTLAGEQPIHDYGVAQEFFNWRSTAPGGMLRMPRVNIAANLSDSGGTPQLDLFFDTSSHGTHVTGIAAGFGLYAVAGFDGVAPGARVIGLKIADDADGAVSTTGAMVRALEYAIQYAHERSLPLVVNLSFGVGNEIEGTARIDAMIDSVLAVHPDVVMTIAAGNDGPGLSTIGFPGSAARALSVGATLPVQFLGAPSGTVAPDLIASFSSRGGEVAGPDVVVPGAAYSTVPNYAIGDEQEEGTSMAAPYAAGLAARLLSALHAAGRTAPAYLVRDALRLTAHPLAAGTVLDEGAGIPDLTAAWAWLAAQSAEVADLAVDVGRVHGRGAVVLTASGTGALGARVTLRRVAGAALPSVRLHTDASWLRIPETVALHDGSGEFTVQAVPATTFMGALTASISVEASNSTVPLAAIPVTIRAVSHGVVSVAAAAGGVARLFVAADSGRGLQLEIANASRGERVTAALHEPGGMPFRDEPTTEAGDGAAAAMFDIGGDDVGTGLYEVDVVANALAPVNATITARLSPVRLAVSAAGDTLHALARSLIATPIDVRLRAGLLGASRTMHVVGHGGDAVRLVLPTPSWAVHAVLDSRMPPAAWARYTDFGVVFFDRAGHQIDNHATNYAFSRASLDLPATLQGDSLVILLQPGYADPDDHGDWSIDLNLKYYVEKPYSLDNGGSPVKSVAPGALRDELFVHAPLPIAIPAGFVPLITVVALDGDDHIWTRELTISRPTGSVP